MTRVECNESELFQFAQLFCDSEVDLKKIEKSVKDILEAIGEDPDREGLQKTPDRVARAYREMLEGYRTDPIKLVNKALFTVEYDDMVIVRDIEFFSMCEHHMLPFLGRAHVAYLPKDKVIGLSKIPRIVDMFSRRLQVQERMTRQIADFLNILLNPRGVAVVVEAVHMCAMVRGVRKHDARMTTSSMLGAFRTRDATRMEFLDNISRGARPLEF
ncbi:MAG TPA: GTP cyclohydrolase I FolE [Anaerolineaceae bacterium]|uniref:GTP cyclohydrolase 1 n=1 Tax=Anaerolinea thermophila TaxID=167964 RepID=A0A101FZ66_9CHLR|nr:MAG: GTP cyclohydrolase 1 [Anaerolinea thermophila]HAF62194.1 GTP cyclohydrolase I FolE [Anaerolineaceae bacterium]